MLYFGAKININADLRELLAKDAPSVQALDHVRSYMQSADTLTIAVQSPNPEANALMIEKLAEVIADWPEVAGEVMTQKDYTVLRDHLLYMLSPEALLGLKQKLQDARRRTIAERLRPKLSGAQFDASRVVVGDDWDTPVDAALAKPQSEQESVVQGWKDELTAERERLRVVSGLEPRDIAAIWPLDDADNLQWKESVTVPLKNHDGTVFVLRAPMIKPATDVRFVQHIAGKTEDLISSLNPSTFHPQMRIKIVSQFDISGDIGTLLGDLRRATWISLVLVIGVLLIGFRKIQALIIFIPVFCATAATLCFARLFYGELNSLTAFLFAVLFGMGVDFSLHLYSHYQHQGGIQKFTLAFPNILKPLTVAMCTTVISLLTLKSASFQSFQSFGVLSAIGVFLCFISSVVLMPLLVPEQISSRVGNAPHSVSFQPWITRALFAGILCLSVLGFAQIEFENDLRNLRSKPHQGDNANIHYHSAISDHRGSISTVMWAEDPRDLRRAIEHLKMAQHQACVGQEKCQHWLRDIVALSTSMPTAQEKKQEIIYDIKRELEKIPEDYWTDQSPTWRNAIETLLAQDPLEPEELPMWLTQPFLERNGRNDRIAHLYLNLPHHDLAAIMRHVEEVREVLRGISVELASTSFVFADLGKAIQHDIRRFPIYVAVAIIFVLLVLMKNMRAAFQCFMVLLLGVGMSLGVMVLLGIKINFYNLVVMPAVLGLGIDASVHLWHQAQGEKSGEATRKATWLASLTTIAAFAGLCFTRHPGLQSIGYVGALSISCCMGVAWLAFARTKD